VYYAIYEEAKQAFGANEDERHHPAATAAAGALATAAGDAVNLPLDVVKQRLQVRTGQILSCLHENKILSCLHENNKIATIDPNHPVQLSSETVIRDALTLGDPWLRTPGWEQNSIVSMLLRRAAEGMTKDVVWVPPCPCMYARHGGDPSLCRVFCRSCTAPTRASATAWCACCGKRASAPSTSRTAQRCGLLLAPCDPIRSTGGRTVNFPKPLTIICARHA